MRLSKNPVDLEAHELIQIKTLESDAGRRYDLFESETGTSFQAGDLVEVRPATEILATLDSEGKLDGIPFMPEMLQFCGGRYKASHVAEHTCAKGEPRRLHGAIHLTDVRCDGSAHQNCQAKCLIFWRDEWVRRVELQSSNSGAEVAAPVTEALSAEGARIRILPNSDDCTRADEHICQATELRSATCPLDLRKASYGLSVLSAWRRGRIHGPELRALLEWLRCTFIWMLFVRWARAPWNKNRFRVTPSRSLDLEPGEQVRVRSMWAILATLDKSGRNRGMVFKPEMFKYCRGTFRVLSRLDRRIDEHSRRMVKFQERMYFIGWRLLPWAALILLAQ